MKKYTCASLSKSVFWGQVRLLETQVFNGVSTEDTNNNEQLFLVNVYGDDVSCARMESMLW
jgi:hypothetical protein